MCIKKIIFTVLNLLVLVFQAKVLNASALLDFSSNYFEYQKKLEEHYRIYGVKNYCQEKYYERSSVARICPNSGFLPKDKTRNFHRNSQHFLCSKAISTKVRQPQNFDFEKWADLLEVGPEGKNQALAMRRAQPEIRYDDSLNYSTYEAWNYEVCEEITSASVCGTKNICIEVKETRRQGERVVVVPVKECRTVPLKCFSDVQKEATLYCSSEKIKYDLHFERPELSKWQPGVDGFDDAIPNKYDLLPGEYEYLHVANHSKSMSSNFDPQISIEQPKNNYSFKLKGSARGAMCRPRQDLALDISVTTNHRIPSLSPNSFKDAVNWDGEKISPIEWVGQFNSKGEYIEKALPKKIRLQDIASGMVRKLSEISQQPEGTKDVATEQNSEVLKKPFNKNTKLRIRLIKKSWWSFYQTLCVKIYSQIQGIHLNLNTLSDDQGVRHSDFWEIDLDHDEDSSLYRKERWFPFKYLMSSKTFRYNLRPGGYYALKISVYHQGVYFYNQDCETNPKQWFCGMFYRAFGKGDDYYFSQELEIPFRTPKNYDPRTVLEKILDYTIYLPGVILDRIGDYFSWNG